MNEIKEMLLEAAYDAMLDITKEEMPELIHEYHIFMDQVKALEAIDTLDVAPLAFPYEIETSYLREDEVIHTISQEEILSQGQDVLNDQIKVPKVVV